MMKRVLGAFLLATLVAPGVAQAQFRDSYNFLEAVRKRDGEKATKLVNEPGTVIINARDQTTEETALHIVTRERDLVWMNFLLARDAQPDLRDKSGTTPLLIAAQIGFLEGADALIKKRAGVNIPNGSGETPLILAVQNRDARMVQLLMTAGANPNKADTSAGLSAFDYAKRDRRSAAILKILESKPATSPSKVAGPN